MACLSLSQEAHNGLDGLRNAAFRPIVHEDVGRFPIGASEVYQLYGAFSHAWLRPHNPVVGPVSLHGLVVRNPKRGEESNHDMGGCK
jgi:hypothetical protein